MVQKYLLASDFDQTLSFNDSGVALSELIGFHGFHGKVRGIRTSAGWGKVTVLEEIRTVLSISHDHIIL